MRVHNFGAGPAALPLPVLERMSADGNLIPAIGSRLPPPISHESGHTRGYVMPVAAQKPTLNSREKSEIDTLVF